MRMFADQMECLKEVERDLWELGVLVKGEKSQSTEVGMAGWTKELMGYSYSLPLQEYPVMQALEFVGLDKNLILYAATEFEDRISGENRNPGNSWKVRPEYWKRYFEQAFDGTFRFSYTYSERFLGTLREAISHLKKEPWSRQAIVSVWDRGIDSRRLGTMRVPCSMYYQFLIREREGKPHLDLIYNMRSCDYYTHFVIDQTIALKLGLWATDGLDVEPGVLINQIGSLHAYFPDLQKRGVF